MTVKWATFLFKTTVLPLAKVHKAYKDRLIVLDRFFEKKSFKVNTCFGILLGSVLYICSLPLRTYYVDKPLWQIWSELREFRKYDGRDNEEGEFPIFVQMRKMNQVLSQVYEIRDEAEGRRLLQEIDNLEAEK